MLRTAIAFATASSIGLGGVATEETLVKGKDKELGKVLAGVATLFVIAKALEAAKDARETEAPEVTRDPAPNLYGDEYRAPRTIEPTAEDIAALSRTVPATCVFDVTGAFGAELVAGRDCLSANSYDPTSLPAFCEKSIETRLGPREVFDVECLSRWGYAVEARR
jgi:hypothetical protein